jgi:hypothetical protein
MEVQTSLKGARSLLQGTEASCFPFSCLFAWPHDPDETDASCSVPAFTAFLPIVKEFRFDSVSYRYVTIVSGFEQCRMCQVNSSMYIPIPVSLTMKAQPDRDHDQRSNSRAWRLHYMIRVGPFFAHGSSDYLLALLMQGTKSCCLTSTLIMLLSMPYTIFLPKTSRCSGPS